jgi:hypothetical protein
MMFHRLYVVQRVFFIAVRTSILNLVELVKNLFKVCLREEVSYFSSRTDCEEYNIILQRSSNVVRSRDNDRQPEQK